MENFNILESLGLVCNIRADALPENLREFLSIDDQGIEGLEFMLSDSKLYKRIPPDVRITYEVLFGNLSLQLDNEIGKIIKKLNDLLKDNTAKNFAFIYPKAARKINILNL